MTAPLTTTETRLLHKSLELAAMSANVLIWSNTVSLA